ncbi:MAG TPA: FAD-dependent oxidoreductase [Thermoanaerobaculia bacterium]|nr:FAD-dependent oxidoreductase [Thermoanaerobaculia bacterium]
MPGYPYLIVGGGMTADAAVRGIRELDTNSPIGLIGAEEDPPYSRPPLSKALWKGEPLDSVWRKTSEAGVDLYLGRRVTTLDLSGKRVIDDQGVDYGFDRLLLATGGTPRRLPFGGEHVTYFRTLDDYRRLRAHADGGKAFAVIGGGFIGSEIAAALAIQGREVTMLFPEDGIGARVFPPDLARFLVGYYGEKGVHVRPGEQVTGISESGARLIVATKGGRSATVDAVVAGIGIVPDTALAAAAGLAVDDGIVVDERLRTSHPDIFAAGDVARFQAPSLGKRMRVEHEDNALTMGKAAGRSMVGDATPYSHLPFFYSDLFDLGYEAVGELDPRGETVSDWKVPFREGVVYYLSSGRVRGVLLWNTWGQVDNSRALIAEPGPFEATVLVGRLPS